MRKNEMGEIARTDKARYSAIRRVLKSELEDINTNYIMTNRDCQVFFNAFARDIYNCPSGHL